MAGKETSRVVRLRIGVLFTFRKGWMGGIIYIINLVNALNFLDDEEKPEVVLFYHDDLAEFIPQFNYPHLTVVPHTSPGIVGGYLGSLWLRRNLFVERLAADHRLDGIYPLNDWPVPGDRLLAKGTRVVAWIPDLQHKFYPHFFNPLRVRLRELRIKWLLKNTRDLAVSSKDVEGHFRKFYHISPGLRIHVLRFVSSVGDKPFVPIEVLQQRYGIPGEYFLISNQFTNHKNHPVVLRAIALLKKRGQTVNVVCTGNMNFSGNEQYMAVIRNLIAVNQLGAHVFLLGVIPRHDQLSLMNHARAIIQPSLFEGWSTVIEDAKTLQVPVIASNLPVNVEQMGDQGLYFDPHNEEQLADLLLHFDDTRKVDFESYAARVRGFAVSFLSIFRQHND